jgi:predicted metalloprotease
VRPGGSFARIAVAAASAALLLSACATVVDGRPTVANAPNATIHVTGDSGSEFDTTVKNAISDILDFWTVQYPQVSGGKSLEPLKGGLYSVDGLKVAETKRVQGPAASEGCIAKNPTFIIDNGAFCLFDDSIAWDRAPTHLFAQLAHKYGPLMVALIFAHEVGHAISDRLGVFDQNLPTIDTESQADCAAGAWAASALKGEPAHFRDVTPAKLDQALEGFLDGRDGTPDTPQDISHGNGFDRLSAVADGIDKGASYCYSDGYFTSRVFTERQFTRPEDYNAGGNQPIADVVSSDSLLVQDLNRFWTAQAKIIHKPFTPVKIAEASHPKCADTGTAQFGYCPGDNTVYYSRTFAESAYNSLPDVDGDPKTGNVTLLEDQPGDFALGVLFSIGWGMAIRHQFFNRDLDGQDALIAAVCYTGSYAKDVNISDDPTNTRKLVLSPADLDEATSSMLDQVGRPESFGARGSTGLDRIQAFVKGYRGGLSTC